jgi:hypothetical protein
MPIDKTDFSMFELVKGETMKLICLLSFVLLAGCATKRLSDAKIVLPEAANSSQDLKEQFPVGSLVGDIDYEQSPNHELYQILLVKRVSETVPSMVAVYRKNGEDRRLVYSAETPFRPNACRAGDCIFRYANYPYPVGFEISLLELKGEQVRQDFLFRWEKGDFRLIRRSVGLPGHQRDSHGVARADCSETDDLIQGKRVEVIFPRERKGALSDQDLTPQYLKRDSVKFAQVEELKTCHASLGSLGKGFNPIQ